MTTWQATVKTSDRSYKGRAAWVATKIVDMHEGITSIDEMRWGNFPEPDGTVQFEFYERGTPAAGTRAKVEDVFSSLFHQLMRRRGIREREERKHQIDWQDLKTMGEEDWLKFLNSKSGAPVRLLNKSAQSVLMNMYLRGYVAGGYRAQLIFQQQVKDAVEWLNKEFDDDVHGE